MQRKNYNKYITAVYILLISIFVEGNLNCDMPNVKHSINQNNNLSNDYLIKIYNSTNDFSNRKHTKYIYASLFNQLDRNMNYTYYNISGGNQILPIMNTLFSQNNQTFEFVMNHENHDIILSHYLYSIIFDDNVIELDIIFYKNFNTGHEFYGMLYNEQYCVNINIVLPGIVEFYIWNRNII